jgi:hypothetical protein
MSQYMWQSQNQRQSGREDEPEEDYESSDDGDEEEEGFRGGDKELHEDFKVKLDGGREIIRRQGGKDSLSITPQEVLFFVIDCASDSMFQPIPATGDVPAAMALRCFAGVVESKMLKSPSDLVSLVFYGTVSAVKQERLRSTTSDPAAPFVTDETELGCFTWDLRATSPANAGQ